MTITDLDRLLAPVRPRAPEIVLPTVDEIVAAWGLPHHLAAAVRHMAAASPLSMSKAGARAQGHELRRAWGHLHRARRELAAGILPTRQPVDAARAAFIKPAQAAEILALTEGLALALPAVKSATETIDRDTAGRHLDEAMAMLSAAIEVRDALGNDGETLWRG